MTRSPKVSPWGILGLKYRNLALRPFPSGNVEILLRLDKDAPGGLGEYSFLRTARNLFDGRVFAK